MKNVMQSAFMDFEFGKLHYQYLMSNKDTTLFLLHAFHSSTSSYHPLCEIMKNKYNLVCLDLPGHGLSTHIDCDKYPWYYSMDGFTEVIIEFIKHFNFNKYYIIGDSVGGNCAVRGITSLHSLSGIVLMGSAQATTVEMLFSLHHQTRALDLLFQKQRTLKEDHIVAAAYVNPELNNGQSFRLMLHDLQNTDQQCREYFSKQLATQKWVDELQIIQDTDVALMYIIGNEDGFINSSHYRDILIDNGLNNSQINILDDVRHVPQLDNPKTTAKLICDFISKH